MPTGALQLYNYNPNIAVPGASLRYGDPAVYGNPDLVGEVSRLAPGQCLVMSTDTSAQAPEECSVIARLDTAASVAFWLADFEIEGANSSQRYTCPAAVEGRLTVCIMPQR
jgi:hypothetical protein